MKYIWYTPIKNYPLNVTLKMRLEESGVILGSSQIFTLHTIAAKTTLLLDNCSFQVKPIHFFHFLIHTPYSSNPWFDLNNSKPIQVMTISPILKIHLKGSYMWSHTLVTVKIIE